IIAQLVVSVLTLHPIARHHHVQMDGIFSTGFIIHTIEKCSGIADVVHLPELGRIEKAAGSFGIRHHKIAPTRSAQPERTLLEDRAEGSVACEKATGGLLAASRPGRS